MKIHFHDPFTARAFCSNPKAKHSSCRFKYVNCKTCIRSMIVYIIKRAMIVMWEARRR